MPGPFVHRIDPVLTTVCGLHLWWYGLSYALGFLNAHLFLIRRRASLGLDLRAVYDLSIVLAAGVLLGGRFVEIIFYEWPFYREHPHLIPAFWLGGMATHGLLLGGLAAVWIFSRIRALPFLALTDTLAAPAAVILGIGRLGNFIDGQIVGSITSAPWAVRFPDAEGFRHPVVLYDGLKNLLLIPVLLWTARREPPRGLVTGLFLFLYAFLRLFVDLFREYPTTLLGLATGQALNLAMAATGLALWLAARRRERAGTAARPREPAGPLPPAGGLAWRRILFAALLLFSLVLPSDWTQDIPARYGKRHPGLHHSALYPPLKPPSAAKP